MPYLSALRRPPLADRSLWQRTERWRGMPAALALIAVITVIDVVTQTSAVVLGFLSLAPLLAAAVEKTRRTALVTVVACLVALIAGLPSGMFGSLDHLLRSSVVFAVGIVSIYVARSRNLREARLRRMTEIAEVAQRAVLRSPPPVLDDVALVARYLSASEAANVGGDLYATVASPYGVRLIIGDACGKGLQAVQMAATVMGAFRQSAFVQPELTAVAADLDQAVHRDAVSTGQPAQFVTAALVQLHGDTVTVINCGHPAPALRTAEGTLEILEPADRHPPLGLRRDAPDPAPVIRVWHPGDRLLLYTDGLIEARNGGGEFLSSTRVTACLDLPDRSEALDRIVAELQRHAGGQISDDAALLLVERQGGAGSHQQR
ncbi:MULTISPECIES: PP2C family protein-serine/threonine phosphatase [unclassified Solwaraspora]|uniref:PP2C family protein-serine/threonine phosphatase n=1 Tax=unclassified Solwaraspora TaxID=2627926 RepID=UPI00259B289A|nr:PP2C family protein-serine/threonine phosphatase [Solwaraspora sp. WMMA2056]WJK40164.1 PP2C family protein-serine/threonine phosphatase [Solwaraspora sp. WMMA2056]